MIINCLAVDDEPLAMELVSSYVAKTPFLKLIGKCSTAQQAMQQMTEHRVDLIFLDIQMPDMTGVAFARAMGKGARIIFTTAYEQYALEGFRLDALDYLVKPFNYEEFLRAAHKAKEHFELCQKAARPEPPPAEEDSLFVKADYKLIRIKFEDIQYVEGLKDYVKIYAGDKPVLSLLSLKALEEKLPSHKFIRVHRSYIVALDKITTIANSRIVFGKVNIPISPQYKEAFYQVLQDKIL